MHFPGIFHVFAYALHPGKYFYIAYMNIEYANAGRFLQSKIISMAKRTFFFFRVVSTEIRMLYAVILFHLVSWIFRCASNVTPG